MSFSDNRNDLSSPCPTDEATMDRLMRQITGNVNGSGADDAVGGGASPVSDTVSRSRSVSLSRHSSTPEPPPAASQVVDSAAVRSERQRRDGDGNVTTATKHIRDGFLIDIGRWAISSFLGPTVAEGGHTEDERCDSRLDEQTNSFFVTPMCCSAPFILACSITAFKLVVFVMAFESVQGQEPVAATDFFVAAAQFISIFISAMTQDDVTNGIKLFDEGYYALEAHFNVEQTPPTETESLVVQPGDGPNQSVRPDRLTERGTTAGSNVGPLGYVTRWKWTLAVVTHLVEGLFGLTVTYEFIVRSSTVLETLLNFAAVEFVGQLDNVFFELSLRGFMGERCFSEARKIKREVYCVHGRSMPFCCGQSSRARNNMAKSWLRFLVFIFMLCPWIKLVVEQQRGVNLPPNMIAQFGDQAQPFLPSFSGRYVRVKAQRPFRTNRFLWKNEAYGDRLYDSDAEGLGTFGYCSQLKRWTFSVQNENDPCQDTLVISSKAPKYDFWQTETLSWFVRSRRTFSLLESFTISPTCGVKRNIRNDVNLNAGIDSDLCRNDGECSSNNCTCKAGGLGRRCQWKKEDICSKLQIDERYGKLRASRELASVYELLTDESDGEMLLIYDHPVYVGDTTFHNGMDVIVYTGLRWAMVSSTNGFSEKELESRTDIIHFLRSANFHPKTSIDKVDLVTTQVRIDSVDDKASPIQLEWLKPVNETNFASLKLDAATISQASLICSVCTSPDGKCLNTGVCKNDKCECNDGETGARCQKLPLGNGHCNPSFNSVSFRYDGGDCCKSTCESGEFECGTATFKVDDIIHSFSSDFPYCKDTNVLGSCRGIVEGYGAGCWIRGCVGDSCWVNEKGDPFQGLGIYQPTAEQVFLSRDGSVAILLEQKGTRNGYSGVHLFTTVDSKFVHRSFFESNLLGATVHADSNGEITVYGLTREGEAKANQTKLRGFQGWTFKTIKALDGEQQTQRLYASDGVLSKLLPNNTGIMRYKVLNGTFVGKGRDYITTWRGSSGHVVFAQSQRRSHGVLAVNANTFQYLAVTNKTYSKDGRLINLQFDQVDNRTIEGCSGIEGISFFELESKANRVHVLCRNKRALDLFEYDLNFPNKTKAIKSFQYDGAVTFRFSADGSTLVFNHDSELRVYRNQTLWDVQLVEPVHKRKIDRFALSGDGSTIVTSSQSHVPQLFRVIPLRCPSPERPVELLISVKILFYVKELTVRWSFDSGDERLSMGSMNFTNSLEDEARLCLPMNPRLSQMTLESLPVRRLPIAGVSIFNENRFSFSVTLNATLCCSGFVDDFNKTMCDFRRCIPDSPLPPESPPSSAPSKQPTEPNPPAAPPTRPPTNFPSPGPTAGPTSSPTLAPSPSPTLSAQPTVRGATPMPTEEPSDGPSLSPTVLPSRMPTTSPVIVTLQPSPLSSVVGCVWPNLAQCGDTFISNNPNARLEGTIPTMIGLWTKLTDLSLSANELSGTLPSEVGLLTNLLSFSVFGNNLSGTIPTTIGQLTRVQQLWLDNNHFTGTIPSELGLLTSIRKIDVQFNECTGTVPTELGRAKTLQGINLFGNLLTGTIPSEICQAVTDKVLIDCDQLFCEPGCCRGRFGTSQC